MRKKTRFPVSARFAIATTHLIAYLVFADFLSQLLTVTIGSRFYCWLQLKKLLLKVPAIATAASGLSAGETYTHWKLS